MSDVSLDDKLKCVKRELQMRNRVYPGWVQKGKLSLSESIHQIRVMEAIVEDYEALAMKERLL